MVKLSPSRLKTLQSCGILYWNTYKRGNNPLPRGQNSGSNRGSTVHFILECLIRPDRRERVERMLKAGDPWIDSATKRLALIHAKKLDVADEANFEMIRQFVLTALQTDFYGDEFGATKVIAEKEFNIKTDKYHIGGFVDKIFFAPGKLKGIDYKSSKAKFTGEDVTFNLQNYFYSSFLEEEYKKRPEFEFQFLKFPKKPIQESPPISDKEMEGFKEWLGTVTDFLENFTWEQAKTMAAKNGGFSKKWLCGGDKIGEQKADGSGEKWICSQKFPYVYFILRDEDGKPIQSEKERAILEKKMKPEWKITQEYFEGCPAFRHLWKTE